MVIFLRIKHEFLPNSKTCLDYKFAIQTYDWSYIPIRF